MVGNAVADILVTSLTKALPGYVLRRYSVGQLTVTNVTVTPLKA